MDIGRVGLDHQGPAGETFDACLLRGVDCVQWLGGPQSDSLIYKRYSLANRDKHPLSIEADTWAAIRAAGLSPEAEAEVMGRLNANYASGAWFNRQKLQDGKTVFNRAETRRRLGVEGDRKLAVIFAHILYDATFFYGESLFADYETWLVETVRSAIDNPHMDWVVKVHPVNVWRSQMDGVAMEQLEARALRQAFGELPHHVRLLDADTEINTFSLFSAIDAGVTVRGTVGMEMPCYGIPAVTAGTGRYSGAGFTIDPPNVPAYRQVLATLHERPPLGDETISAARLYAHTIFMRRPIAMRSFMLDFRAKTLGLPHLAQDVFLHPDICRTGMFQQDVVQIADWMAYPAAGDLFAPHAALAEAVAA